MSPDGRDRAEWRSLRGTRSFSRVYDDGVKMVGRLFVLFLYPGDDLARAVVASRKVGGAVARNRAKRLLREAIRSCIEKRDGAAAELRRRFFPDAAPEGGLWLVAVARAGILSVRCPDVVAELTALLDRRPVPRARPARIEPDPGTDGGARGRGARG